MRFLNLFHTLLHKSLITIFAVAFAVVMVYVPQIPQTDAGGVPGMDCGPTRSEPCTSFLTQLVQLGEQGIIAAKTAISATADPVTAAMTSYDWTKSSVLDGLAWSLAKATISRMTASIINWVNSGFQGSPSFVTDIRGFLTDIADQVVGDFMMELGGPFSFVCSPFQLDVKIALEVKYQATRAGQPPAGKCTLTGALKNIENFFDGTRNFLDEGWDAWFSIATNPEQYTPLGSTLEAESQMAFRIINAEREELNLLNFGNGFLSSKVCQDVATAAGTRKDCRITTPGNVISEALNFQLSTGPRSLIEADEINELVAAVFGQLTEKAITGTAGLLGLSAGTGYTAPGRPITEEVMAGDLANDPNRLLTQIESARNLHDNLIVEAIHYRALLTAYANDFTNSDDNRNRARSYVNEIGVMLPRAESNYNELETLRVRFLAIREPQSNAGVTEITAINQDFLSMDLYTKTDLDAYVASWQAALRQRTQ